MPVIVFSNLMEDEELMRRFNVFGHIVKADWKMEDVVRKVKEAMK